MTAVYRLPPQDPEVMRKTLPNLADGLHAQLEALHDAPSESACEQLAANLDGARRYVLRFAEAIRNETRK